MNGLMRRPEGRAVGPRTGVGPFARMTLAAVCIVAAYSSAAYLAPMANRGRVVGLRGRQVRLAAFDGLPSTPGWEGGRLDQLTNWAVAEESNRPVICIYKPDALWLWTKWRGTVLSLTVLPVLITMS